MASRVDIGGTLLLLIREMVKSWSGSVLSNAQEGLLSILPIVFHTIVLKTAKLTICPAEKLRLAYDGCSATAYVKCPLFVVSSSKQTMNLKLMM